jgi:hypothetical protein
VHEREWLYRQIRRRSHASWRVETVQRKIDRLKPDDVETAISLQAVFARCLRHQGEVFAAVERLLDAEEHGEQFESVAQSAEALFSLRARMIEVGPPGIYRAGQSESLREEKLAAHRAHRSALNGASIETEAYYEILKARESLAAREARYGGSPGVSSSRPAGAVDRISVVTGTFDDYDAAVRAFWTGRDLQTQRQIDSGVVDAGTRGSVTGGQHMEPLQNVIADQFEPLRALGCEVGRTGILSLPGFYRRTKNWDIVVTYKDVLIAAIEAKSQVGSFGNNFNNRTEEAIGNAVDIWRAYEAGLLGTVRPWLGFVFVLERQTGSTTPIRDRGEPLFRADPAFDNSSYTDRYRLLFERLVRERLYDAACLISTEKGAGIHSEPAPEVSTRNLTAAIAGRVAYIEGLAL